MSWLAAAVGWLGRGVIVQQLSASTRAQRPLIDAVFCHRRHIPLARKEPQDSEWRQQVPRHHALSHTDGCAAFTPHRHRLPAVSCRFCLSDTTTAAHASPPSIRVRVCQIDSLLVLASEASERPRLLDAFKLAVDSLSKYPLPVRSAEEAGELVGIGRFIAHRIGHILRTRHSQHTDAATAQPAAVAATDRGAVGRLEGRTSSSPSSAVSEGEGGLAGGLSSGAAGDVSSGERTKRRYVPKQSGAAQPAARRSVVSARRQWGLLLRSSAADCSAEQGSGFVSGQQCDNEDSQREGGGQEAGRGGTDSSTQQQREGRGERRRR